MAINDVCGKEKVYHVLDRPVFREFLGHNYVSGLRTYIKIFKKKLLKTYKNLQKTYKPTNFSKKPSFFSPA